MKQCPRCSNKYLPDDAKYCIQCGNKINIDVDVPDFIKDLFNGDNNGFNPMHKQDLQDKK